MQVYMAWTCDSLSNNNNNKKKKMKRTPNTDSLNTDSVENELLSF